MLIANMADGLTPFEFEYLVNLKWWRTSPWLGLTGLLESGATFGVVCAVAFRRCSRRSPSAWSCGIDA